MKISVSLSTESLDKAIQGLDKYRESLEPKCKELARKLAEMGATNVSIQFARAIYTGPLDYAVSVEDADDGRYQIVVSGQSVAFVEFGAGVTYGYGHPQAAEFGVGPGTYPGQTHAMTGEGWYLPKSKRGNTEDPNGHTYGNPPNMPMYNTAQDLKEEVARVVREVFST